MGFHTTSSRIWIAWITTALALIAGAPIAVAQEPAEPAHVSLSGKLPTELKVKRARTGHLLVAPQINGEDAGWFIFDTGAGMSCADKKLVERLKLPDAGEASARGTGGVQATRLRQFKTLSLGPITIGDSTLVELDLAPIAKAMGEQIDGVIGYDCFLAGVFEVDLENAKITVHDPATHKLPDGQNWQPLTFIARRPHVPGQIEDHEKGVFLIDIGANSSLTIDSLTVEKLKLLDGRQTDVARSGGVGGIHAARKGNVKSMTICGQRVAEVPAIFLQARKGVPSDADVQGSVGVGLLKKFLLVVNYKGKSVALLPRPGA